MRPMQEFVHLFSSFDEGLCLFERSVARFSEEKSHFCLSRVSAHSSCCSRGDCDYSFADGHASSASGYVFTGSVWVCVDAVRRFGGLGVYSL